MKQKTIAHLTLLPDATREIIQDSLPGRIFLFGEETIEITRSRLPGQVAAVRKMFQHLGLAELICAQPCREREVMS